MSIVSITSMSTVVSMRKQLYSWFKKNGRHDLPWRQTQDPYKILISEVMLQQTQVSRVHLRWEKWIAKWPNINSLASASRKEVIQEWAGLGYNRRSVNLHRTVQELVLSHKGQVPINETILQRLPGIGPYTAAAITCFTENQKTQPIDTNISRLITRAFLGLQSPNDSTKKIIQQALIAFEPNQNFRKHYLALMDLGALVCQSRAPSCHVCPWQNNCSWFQDGKTPTTTPKKHLQPFSESARFARGRIIDYLREKPAMTTEEIQHFLPDNHKKQTAHYLEVLVTEGLIEKKDDNWSLPN
jgi:A/G-specific adenine glycosylase